MGYILCFLIGGVIGVFLMALIAEVQNDRQKNG